MSVRPRPAPAAPRIVRLLPSRFSRDPTAARSGENTAAALLLVFTVLAIVWANSPWAESYSDFWNTHVGLTSATCTPS